MSLKQMQALDTASEVKQEPVRIMGFDCVCGRRMEVSAEQGVVPAPQRKPLPPQSPCEMTQAEGRMFKLGWLECEAAHGIKE